MKIRVKYKKENEKKWKIGNWVASTEYIHIVITENGKIKELESDYKIKVIDEEYIPCP